VIDGFESIGLLFEFLIYLFQLHGIHKGRLDVIPLEYPGIPPLLWLKVVALGNLVEFLNLLLSHNLLCVVFQKLKNGCLLSHDILQFFNPLENGHFFFRLSFRVVFRVNILRKEQFLQDPNSLI